MNNNNNKSEKKSIKLQRRQLLGYTTKGSALCAASAWVSPAILAVSLPGHAQATISPTEGPNPAPTPAPLVCPAPQSSSGSLPRTQLEVDEVAVPLSQFNLTAGNLATATLDYSALLTADFRAENTGNGQATLELEVMADITIIAPDGTVLVTIMPSGISAGNVVETSDGTTDFAGPSGLMQTVDSDPATGTGTIDLIAAGIDPNLFIGNGNVDFFVTSNGQSQIRGGSSIISTINTFISAEFTINYTCSL